MAPHRGPRARGARDSPASPTVLVRPVAVDDTTVGREKSLVGI